MAKCSNPDCKVEETGKCIEGFNILEDCVTYGTEVEQLASEIIDTPASDKLQTVTEHIYLQSGDILNPKDVDLILNKHGGIVVACVGPSNIGKTTLLASFYELFSRGSIDQFVFGGSQTLFAFEEICHLSRAASNNTQPKTQRTSRQDLASFYHIALSQKPDSKRVDLLLGDRAGEEYEAAIDNKTSCLSLYEVYRSDVLLLLIDGKALGENKTRHVAKRRANSLIQALVEENQISYKSKIIIVMTRYDLAFQDGNSDKAIAELENLLSKVRSTLNGKNIDVSSHVVAARPEGTEHVKVAYGVPELIKVIIKTNVKSTVYESSDNYVNAQILRSFQSLRSY
jgi:GTPase SAR1 family protein